MTEVSHALDTLRSFATGQRCAGSAIGKGLGKQENQKPKKAHRNCRNPSYNRPSGRRTYRSAGTHQCSDSTKACFLYDLPLDLLLLLSGDRYRGRPIETHAGHQCGKRPVNGGLADAEQGSDRVGRGRLGELY